MARVNVEQKALTDPRFGRLGLLLVNDEYHDITVETAQCLGLGRMLRVWNECQERGSYTLTDHDLVVILAHRDAAKILVECGLGEREKRGMVRVRGTKDRIEWLVKAREHGKKGAEHGAKGGRPKETPLDTPEEPPRGLGEKPPPAPAPAPALEPEKKKTPSESKKKNASELVEGFVLEPKHREWAAKNCPTTDPDAVFAFWQDDLRQKNYRTKNGPVADPAASWRTYMRNAQDFGRHQRKGADAPRKLPGFVA